MDIMITLALISGAVMFFCLCSRKTIIIALVISVIWVLIVIFGHRKPEDYSNPETYSVEMKSYLRQRGMSFAEFGAIRAKQTPLERSGDFLTTTLMITALLAVAVVGKLEKPEDKKYAKQIYMKCLAVLIGLVCYFLSLYVGLTLKIIPWIKLKRLQSESIKNKLGTNINPEL